MSLTTDRNDPRLTHGVDAEPVPQADAYLVLSEEERAKGFVRPVRYSYRHVGDRPKHPTRDLTPEEDERFNGVVDDREPWVAFEPYPEGSASIGRFWTAKALATMGCGQVTTMAAGLAETYAREPRFYGATYCATCRKHLPIAEFVWTDDGTTLGS
jgi:hypothetical protein